MKLINFNMNNFVLQFFFICIIDLWVIEPWTHWTIAILVHLEYSLVLVGEVVDAVVVIIQAGQKQVGPDALRSPLCDYRG